MCVFFVSCSKTESRKNIFELLMHRISDSLIFDSNFINKKTLYIGHTRIAILDIKSNIFS